METPKKILLIEDDLYTRELYEEILKTSGFDVTTAVDGEDGLNKVKVGGYTIILLDLVMPKIDGIKFLEEYEKLKLADKNGPVVVFTNLAHDPVIKQAFDKGAKGYLIKSDLNPDQLVREVKSYMG